MTTNLDNAYDAAIARWRGYRPPLHDGWVTESASYISQAKYIVNEIDTYREVGAAACRAQWLLFLRRRAVELEEISNVSVLVCTADVAMKAFANETFYYPANHLCKHSA